MSVRASADADGALLADAVSAVLAASSLPLHEAANKAKSTTRMSFFTSRG
jgi:hypothetical protein